MFHFNFLFPLVLLTTALPVLARVKPEDGHEKVRPTCPSLFSLETA